MPVIAFMSDFGNIDHYISAVKAEIYFQNPDAKIIDISHNITRHNILHAAYVAKQAFNNFPSNTVFILDVDPVVKDVNRLVAARIEDKFILTYDSGLISLMTDQNPTEIIELERPNSTFISKDVFARAAAHLVKTQTLSGFGKNINDLLKKLNRQVKATKQAIVGQVIHIDHYGNLITNILKIDFDNIMKILGPNARYQIQFSRETINNIHNSYNEVEKGECFILFNSAKHLEVGINNGRASDLLGLRIDSQVAIAFNS